MPTTEFAKYNNFTHRDYPVDTVIDFLADQADGFDVDGVADAYLDAINAQLVGTGIQLHGNGFYSETPVPDDAGDTVRAAIAAVDLGVLAERFAR